MDKHTLSLKSINTILDAIEPEKKLLYDKDYIETLYRRYQSTECNDEADIQALSASWSERPLLAARSGKESGTGKGDNFFPILRRTIRSQSPSIYIPEGIRRLMRS
ncbi:MAG: hypothetical protein ACLR8P_16475 [Clostridium fessum]